MAKKNIPATETELSGRLQVVRGNMTQEEFAKVLGIGRTTLIRYESGERIPDANFLQALSLKFNVDPSWLLLGIGKIPERKHFTPEKQALLDASDGMSEDNKRALLQIGESLSQPKPNKFAG